MLQLGKESFRDANYGLAEKYFRKAVEIRPDNATAWAGLAASYDELGRFDLADRAYEQLIKLKGNDARTLNNRGYSYLLRGDYKRAKEMLERAQAIDPGLEEIQGNLTLLDKIRAS
jgi:Flp pilus assembly protein TadD